jgi:cytochrome oxidase assembly protein ShyY1
MQMDQGLLDQPTPFASRAWQESEHRRVILSGQFLHEAEMLVGPRNKGGPGRPGFFVYTPMVLSDGHVVIVNRGWVPRSHSDQSSRLNLSSEALPYGKVSLVGMLRRPDQYQPRLASVLPHPRVDQGNIQSNDEASSVKKRQWLWLNLPDMAKWIQGKTNLRSNQIETSFFVEEVLDATSIADEHVHHEMLEWYKESEKLKHSAETMPTILASAKASQTDPRMFYGKPIISPPSISVPNKHLEYISGTLWEGLFY